MGKEQGRSWRERFTPRPTQWEPFGAKEPNPQNQFQNDYHGPFANKMELNRSGAERFLRVGAVEDRVTLFALPSSWQNLLGEEGKLPVMVTFDRQGWQIGIGGQQIANELLDKRLSSEEIEKESIRQFNWLLKQGFLEVLLREKLSPKYEHNKAKYRTLLLNLAANAGVSSLLTIGYHESLSTGLQFSDLLFFLLNHFTNSQFRYIGRGNIRSQYEYLMPPVAVDRFLRGWAFLRWQGKNLVRETRGESLI